MKFDQGVAIGWLKSVETYLPGFNEALNETNSEILLIGAAVLQNYAIQGWIPPLRRSTGDLDISVGLYTAVDEAYQIIKSKLLDSGFKQDSTHSYRLHSPVKIVSGYNYVDILAHQASDGVTTRAVQQKMGVGEGFNLDGMPFARFESYQISPRLQIPNVFSFLNLKQIAYTDNPTKRVKDLADIIECISGFVNSGTHFELHELWLKVKDHSEAKNLKSILYGLGSGENVQWDIENARAELSYRKFSEEEIDDTLLRNILDFIEELS